MDNPYQPPNPAAPAGSPSRDPALAEPTRSEAPRWLAVLLALLVGQGLLGTGHLILGRRRMAATWLAIGLAMLVLLVASVRFNVPALFFIAFPGLVLAWLASVVSVGFTKRGNGLSSGSALGMAAAVFVLSMVVAFAQRHFLTEAFQIPSAAMLPTLLVGDHLFVAKGAAAEPGDVIVFKYPYDPEVDYVKRVMARGGDTIELRDDVVFINGQQLTQTKLTEPCPPEPDHDTPGCAVLQERNGSHVYRIQHVAGPSSFGPATVPAGHLFVMGDNRHNSNDSRVWGTVPGAMVKGRARFIWWSRLGKAFRWGRIGKRID